ncbi:MAG: hypothetical protein NTX59_13925 [Elusimicrobia bacterium]|nr:hypothetical protein [Elusimicrobiota bacterium]
MIRIQNKKSKSAQYLVGGIIAILILIAWISLPLMSNSSLDSSAASGNPFKSRVSDIGALGEGIPSEGGAPGSPLSGEMTDNPATSGESMASSLFQSGSDTEDAQAADKSASAEAQAPDLSGKFSASAAAPAPRPGAGGAKLTPQASITAGNANSMSTGGAHNKFFGNGSAKADIAPAGDLKPVKAPPANKGVLLAMLGNAADKSQLAAKTNNMDAAKGGATTAFEKSAKADTSDLNTGLENGAASSGLALGQAAQDLKKSDPSLNSNKSKPPEVSKPKEDNTDEEMKKMILQMIIQATLGSVFGAIGQSMAMAINPDYQQKPVGCTPGQYNQTTGKPC